MSRACDRMTLHELRRYLTTDVVGHHIYMFNTVTSTNEVLRKLAEGGATDGTVVVAETQTAGRGRHGTAWFSPEAANLYVSVLFHPKIAPRELPLFAPIASLALAEAAWIESAPALIKWPNDVLVGRRKVGGVLVEAPMVGDQLAYVILGIGVNLNVERAELTQALGALADDAASLQEIVEHEVDRNAFAAGLLNRLEKWQRTFVTRGPSAVLAAWQARDALKGKRVEARTADGVYAGCCRGIQPDGSLLVEDAGGCAHRIMAGAVRLLEPEALEHEPPSGRV
jgi:BirA family transcriptional regulator, biotin operon repressor / biotin---[acetyl-CoA-carboxylase] ligase